MPWGDTAPHPHPPPNHQTPTNAQREGPQLPLASGGHRNRKGSLEGRYLSISNHGDYSHDSCCGKQLKAYRSTCEEMADDKINYLHDGWWIEKAATFPSISLFSPFSPPFHQWLSRYPIVFGPSSLVFSNMFLIRLQLGASVNALICVLSCHSISFLQKLKVAASLVLCLP